MVLGILVIAGFVVIFFVLGYQHGKKKRLEKTNETIVKMTTNCTSLKHEHSI